MPKTLIFSVPTNVSSPVAFARVTDTLPSGRQMAWDELVALIRHDAALFASTEWVRGAYTGKKSAAYADRKRRLPAIAPAVHRFEGTRAADHVRELTGIVPVDLDDLSDEQMARVIPVIDGDPHTFLRHVSPGGHGLRVMMRLTTDSPSVAYRDAWEQVNQYVRLITSVKPDGATKDVGRLSFLCGDATCHYNPAAQPLFIVPMQGEQQRGSATLRELSASGDAFALAARLVEKSGVPFAQGSRHAFLVSFLCYLNKMGVQESEAVAHLEVRYGSYAEENFSRMARSIYGPYAAEFGTWTARSNGYSAPFAYVGAKGCPRGGDGTPAEGADGTPPRQHAAAAASKTGAAVTDAVAFVRERRLRRNVVTGRIEMEDALRGGWRDMANEDHSDLWIEFVTTRPLPVTQQAFDSILHSSCIPAFNPFLHYLSSLEGHGYVYDPATSEDQIEALARRIHLADGDDDPARRDFLLTCLRRWLVAMVYGWLDEDKVNESILTFVGKEKKYKSSFFRELLPPELRRYGIVKDNNSRMDKDDKLTMSEYGLICLDELDSMTDVNLNQLKSLVTTTVISVRGAYERNKSNRPHIATFGACGNNVKFLTGQSGNRRWLTFQVKDIDSPYVHPIPYGELYAQLYYLYRQGFPPYLTDEECALLAAHQEDYEAPCAEEELVLQYFHPHRPENGPEYEKMMTATQLRLFLDPSGSLRTSVQTIGRVMDKLGFPYRRTARQRGYMVVEN